MTKFRFKMEPLCAPDAALVENDRLVGIRFRRTRIENGRVHMEDETFERRGSCIFSSIGSIPEAISGIDMKGELFDFSDWDIGRLDAYPTVFSVGNVVTGKGNIVASRKHAARVSETRDRTVPGNRRRARREKRTCSTWFPRSPKNKRRKSPPPYSGGPGVSAETLREHPRVAWPNDRATVGYESDFAGWMEKAFRRPIPPDREPIQGS